MQGESHKPQNESIEAPTGSGERANVEFPAIPHSDAAQAHTPRPHPPIEEPEDNPDEHAPETEPDEPDDSEQRSPPPRPGKTRR